MIETALIIDITNTQGIVREALEDFSIHMELGQHEFHHVDKSYIQEFIENDFTGEEDLLEGWKLILDELEDQNAESFYLLHRW